MDEEIKRLYESTARTRYQFLTVELQTCHTAIEMAQFELAAGNIVVAEHEAVAVEHGIRVIQRFLSEVAEEQRSKVEAGLVKLQGALDSLKAELHQLSQ